MHRPEKLLRALEHAPVKPFSGFVYRVIAERWRESPLSTIGSIRAGGRYNAPNSFPVLYCADSQMTAMLEVEALFTTADGQLRGVARDPDLVLSLRCELGRVLDLTDASFHNELGTTRDELISLTPSRFIVNARGEETPTQSLGAACSYSGRISALKVPSASHDEGYCLDILPDSMLVGESLSVLDRSGRMEELLEGKIPAIASSTISLPRQETFSRDLQSLHRLSFVNLGDIQLQPHYAFTKYRSVPLWL